MGLLLLMIMFFGTYAAFADTIKDAIGSEENSIWIDIGPYVGYIALGAILMYIPLNLLDKKLYEKALKEHKENKK